MRTMGIEVENNGEMNLVPRGTLEHKLELKMINPYEKEMKLRSEGNMFFIIEDFPYSNGYGTEYGELHVDYDFYPDQPDRDIIYLHIYWMGNNGVELGDREVHYADLTHGQQRLVQLAMDAHKLGQETFRVD